MTNDMEISPESVLLLLEKLNDAITEMDKAVVQNSIKLGSLHSDSLNIRDIIRTLQNRQLKTEKLVFDENQVVEQSLRAKEKEMIDLQKENKMLLTQLSDTNEMIRILSVDHSTLETEQETCEKLQSSIYGLEKEIVLKDNDILRLQADNNQLKVKISELISGVASSLLEDEFATGI